METTLTQRDKALLLILGIIIIIFAAVLIPKVGIYALITNRSELATEINKQKEENQTLFVELIQSGVSGAYAESGAMAKNYLNKLVLSEKHDAAKLSTTVNSSNSYMTARDWINPVKYKGFVSGETSYFDSINVEPSTNGVQENNIEMYEISFPVNVYEAEVEAELSIDNTFSFNTAHCTNVDKLNDLASMIVLSSQLARRGSCIIQVFEYKKDDFSEDGQATVTLTVLVITPLNDNLGQYASTICECHSCGTPYYLSDFETKLQDKIIEEGEGAVVTCTNCGEVIDGTTIG